MSELCEKDVVVTNEANEVQKRSFLLGYYNYTVILTYIGMLVGFLGIMLAARGNEDKALICLIVAGFCDMFDGAIASTRKRTKKEKRFGIQIDSLSDLICFGVLPAVIVNSSIEGSFALGVCGLYVLCALIRLSYFNVDEEDRQNKSEGARKFFSGLPVTTSSLLFPFVFVLTNNDYVRLSVLMAVAIAFLLPFKLKKPNKIIKVVFLAIGAGALLMVFTELI